MEHSKKKKASRGDPAKFRRPRQNGYEQKWFNVSTLLMDSQKADIKGAIEDIQRQYDASDKKLKDLLKPFNVKEQIDVMRRYIPNVSIKRIGDKETWDKISEVGIPQSDVVSQMQGADLIICMVEVIYEKDEVKVNKASLRLLEQCLSARPDDIEIVIITELGIYATEAKNVIFETLRDRNIKLPKAVYHAAETKFEEIVAHRVNEAIKTICILSKSLIDSLPEERETDEVITDAYRERTSQSNISKVAMDVDLVDGNTAIGSVSNAPKYYYNQLKIEKIKKQLREKCTKTVIDQFGNTVTTNINTKILNRLEISEISVHSFYFQNMNISSEILLETISKLIAAIVLGSILSVVFAPIFLIAVPLVAVFRLFSPVNVNDRTWRIECIDVVVVQFRENKTKITSEASSMLVREFQSMKNGLETFKMRRDHSLPCVYDEMAYNHHRNMKMECKRHIEDENLRQHVKKTVFTSDQTANIYVTEKTQSRQYMSARSHRIRIQGIPPSTEEDRRIHKYLIENKPKIEALQHNKIKTIISETSERLFTLHSNLSIIGPSPVKSSEHGTYILQRPCIVFYCIGKGEIPLGEPFFPKILDGIEIDVREGFFVPFFCWKCIVGMDNTEKTGSFGFEANKIKTPSRQGIITAAHVVVGADILGKTIKNQKEDIIRIRSLLVSPSHGDTNIERWVRMYGIVTDIQFGEGVDAAFVEKMDGSSVDHLNFHINQGQLSAPMFNIDQHLWTYQSNVEKCGLTTGLTSGYLHSTGIDLNLNYGSIKPMILKNQYKVYPTESTSQGFFKPGDSGCGVYIVENGQYHPIGIAIGGIHGNDKICFVTPIERILDELELEMYLENMEEDPT